MIMDNKINIAELLKDCPKGMELYSPLFENLEFDRIDKDNGAYSIICCVKTEWECYNTHTFTEYGCYSTEKYSKCVIFPKGKTTWEGFVPPCKFKEGDIISNDIYIAIFYKADRPYTDFEKDVLYYHCWYNRKYNEFEAKIDYGIGFIKEYKLATEEEKQKLFDVIKANGYKWNEETKTLEKLPKFKVGNRIKYINGKNKDGVEQGVILSLTNDTYDVAVTNDMGIFIPISEQDDWELVPNKFDITTLKVFDKVLVRDHNAQEWVASLFSNYNEPKKYKYICVNGSGYAQCIPYEGNEHLLGKIDDCDEFYKNW